MKYFAIVPPWEEDKVQGLFRHRDDGIYEYWTPDKGWILGGYEFFMGSDIGFRDATDQEVAAFINAHTNNPKV